MILFSSQSERHLEYLVCWTDWGLQIFNKSAVLKWEKDHVEGDWEILVELSTDEIGDKHKPGRARATVYAEFGKCLGKTSWQLPNDVLILETWKEASDHCRQKAEEGWRSYADFASGEPIDEGIVRIRDVT